MKNIFAHHGVPETLVTDNGRQFTAAEFRTFTDSWGITHVTSSPYFAQSNGEAERAVKEAKKILAQKDPFLALLTYRSSPTTPTGVSPAELLMGRRIRNTLPTIPENLEPKIADRKTIIERDDKTKEANKFYYDRRNGARNLPELQPGDVVLQKLDKEKGWTNPAMVLSKVNSRSYIIETPSGLYRRNRKHLKPSQCFRPEPSHTPIPFQLLPSPDSTPNLPTLNFPRATAPHTPIPPGSPAGQRQSDPVQPAAESTDAALPPGASSQTSTPSRTTRSGRTVMRPARFRD
ncbi:hypothetical protein ACOMHN_027514 [Nucella lapillus]